MSSDKSEAEREQNRKYMRERRQRAAANGMCGRCCLRKPKLGNKTCSKCLSENYARDKRGRRRFQIHHSSRKGKGPGTCPLARRWSSKWNEVSCRRCLDSAGMEL